MKKQIIIGLILSGICFGCSVSHLSVNENNKNYLSQCFPLPNCVSSESFMFYNSVDSFELLMPADEAWPSIKETLKTLPRTEVITENDHYIHVTCRSLVFRFVDNVEFLLNKKQNTVSVRSGSFIAIFDLGVNYFRISKLRKMLVEKRIIK